MSCQLRIITTTTSELINTTHVLRLPINETANLRVKSPVNCLLFNSNPVEMSSGREWMALCRLTSYYMNGVPIAYWTTSIAEYHQGASYIYTQSRGRYRTTCCMLLDMSLFGKCTYYISTKCIIYHYYLITLFASLMGW